MAEKENATVVKTPEDFVQAYNALVKEYGYQIIAAPEWKQSMDTGTYSLVIKISIIKNTEIRDV